MTQTEINELHGNLPQFTGSDEAHPTLYGVYMSDGVKYLANKASCFWLIDAIASHIVTKKKIFASDALRSCSIWLLTPEKGKACLSCHEDTTEELREGKLPFAKIRSLAVVSQTIPSTDFPFATGEGNRKLPFKMYASLASFDGDRKAWMIYLPSER